MAEPVLPADEVAEPIKGAALDELRRHIEHYRSYNSETEDSNNLLFWLESQRELAEAAPSLLAEVDSLRATVARLRTAADDRNGTTLAELIESGQAVVDMDIEHFAVVADPTDPFVKYVYGDYEGVGPRPETGWRIVAVDPEALRAALDDTTAEPVKPTCRTCGHPDDDHVADADGHCTRCGCRELDDTTAGEAGPQATPGQVLAEGYTKASRYHGLDASKSELPVRIIERPPGTRFQVVAVPTDHKDQPDG